MKPRYARAGRPLVLMILAGSILAGGAQADGRQYGKWKSGEVKRLNFNGQEFEADSNNETRLYLLENRVDGLEASTADFSQRGPRVAALKASGAGVDVGGRYGPAKVDVDCAADESINAAIAGSDPSRPVTVKIVGSCAENVYIRRHDLTIQGAGVDSSGAPLNQITGEIEIDASSRISIVDLSVINGRGTGILVNNGSSVTLINLRVSGHPDTGIGVSKNSFAQISNVVVKNPREGNNAIFIDDGGNAQIRDSVFLSESSVYGDGAALRLSRSGHARLEGDNLIQNTGSSADFNAALAIQVLHTSNLLVQRGANRVVGNVFIASNSNVDLREAQVIGRAGVRSQSRLRLRNTKMRGGAKLSRGSMLQSDRATIELGVDCSNSQSIVVNNGLAGSIGRGCTEEFPVPGF